MTDPGERGPMLGRSLFFLAIAALLAIGLPPILQRVAPTAGVAEPQVAEAAAVKIAGGRNMVVLKGDDRGHFRGSFRINGKPVDGLIDTGASLVAMNESTARSIGLSPQQLKFDLGVNTANGRTQAARVKLDRVELGGIRVNDVDAFVMRDDALGMTLIGMSYLTKLTRYSVSGDRISLER